MTDTLFGRPFSEWHSYDHVLQAHAVKSPKDLNEKLGKASKRAPERRIQVYDSVNKDRLLGSVPVPSCPAHGRVVMFATRAPVVSYKYSSLADMNMRLDTINMEISTRYEAQTWTAEFILVTRSPLNLLTRIDGFRLPGETEAQARDRHYSCA
jgi:hypothetical protein